MLGDLVLDDHILVRVDRVLDLAWLPGAVGACCCADNGRPGIEPEVAVRLMLAGLLLGIAHDRQLMREAQVNLAIRWCIGYGLHEARPDHSSLTRIRQRWGAARFRRIFQRTVEACVAAGIAKGEVVHIDSSLAGPTSAGMRSRGIMLKRRRPDPGACERSAEPPLVIWGRAGARGDPGATFAESSQRSP